MPGRKEHLLTQSYAIPAAAVARLESLVERIEANPGDLIDLHDFEARQRDLDVKQVIQTLREGLTEEDLTGILKLALLTECATDSYAIAIRERAHRFGAGWLARFNDNVWTPDEYTHSDPYKLILMNLGFAEAELDREIKETQEREFVHYGGDTPVHVTTFGMVQEYLTDNWHGLIAKLLKRASPQAAYMAYRVKRRETLHTLWYRDMTAIQVEANPSLVFHVADEAARFRMPGNSLVPELQAQSPRWLPLLGADMERILRDLLRLFHETLGSARLTGAFIVAIAAEKGVRVGPIQLRQAAPALNRLGGPGYGLIGEALLERAGLGYLFRTGRDRNGKLPVSERVRALARSWLADRIPIQMAATAT